MSLLDLENPPLPRGGARLSRENPLWGSLRVRRELQILGIDVSETTVPKYMLPYREPPSQTWRSFLDNHAKDLVSIDFVTVPTAKFRIPYVFLVLRHERRKIIHLNVTPNHSA